MGYCAANELVLKCLCFSPETGIALSEKLADCYRQFVKSTKPNEDQTVIRQTIFISADSNIDYHQKKRELLASAKLIFDKLPPTSIIAQLPENGSLLLEISYLKGVKSREIAFKWNEESSWLAIERNNMKMVVAAGLNEDSGSNNILRQSVSAFEQLRNILQEEEMDFSDIIRQWNYIEQITANTHNNDSVSQHYQIFNDVRSKFYQNANFVNGFPAATGIGMDFGGINIDFIAAKIEGKKSIISLKSPVQLDAYSYSEEVLAKNCTMDDFCRTTPKFERAKVVITPESKWILVSGTAAIVGQSSASASTAERQAEMTIQNILSLISTENLKKHRINSGNEVKINYLRAYIKFKNDLLPVQEICKKYFPNVPVAFVIADICRPELLVEIEGQAEIL